MSNSQGNMTNITRFEMFCAFQILKMCLAPSSRDPKKECRKREDQKRGEKTFGLGKNAIFLIENCMQIPFKFKNSRERLICDSQM
jgi:hypothetical protein